MEVAFIRTIILYVFVVAAVRVMGKRQIGELQPSELVVAILISELASVPMQDPGIPLLAGIVPILTLVACEIVMSTVTLGSVRLRFVISGRPSVLIRNGAVDQKEMKKLRFTIDDLMEELRLNGYMSIEEVACAVMETNGKLSVFPKCENKPVTASMMNITCPDGGLPVTLICDGTIVPEALAAAGHDLTWLQSALEQNCVAPKDVFLMTVNADGKVTVIEKEKNV